MPTTQAMGDARAAEYMRGRRNMEINPQHPIIQALKGKVELESRCALLSTFYFFCVLSCLHPGAGGQGGAGEPVHAC